MNKIIIVIEEIDGKATVELDTCGNELDGKNKVHVLAGLMLTSVADFMDHKGV